MTDNHRIRRAAEYNAMRNTLVRAEFLDTEPGEWIRALPAMPFIGGYSLVPDHHPLIVQFTDPKVAAMFKLTWA